MTRPFGLVAELTYACPLHCGYCSNPIDLDGYRDEMTTGQWQRVLEEARDLGVLQAHFSGGEPLQRHDVVDIVGTAHELGLYTNLVTSGLGLSRRRAEQLNAAVRAANEPGQPGEPALTPRAYAQRPGQGSA
ncbi:radical SAM protein [Amycolatopsis taiwanensis]|uniref:radical SAM protein n=1 Tax=Amycolatopsis taiwanensis TaxID=342230 RepID=UPI0004895B31